jgi:hypothetical protein
MLKIALELEALAADDKGQAEKLLQLYIDEEVLVTDLIGKHLAG